MTSNKWLAEYIELFYQALPEDGSPIQNEAVRRFITSKRPDIFTDEFHKKYYWEIRTQLLNKGDILLSRGRGGLVRRVLTDAKKTQAPSNNNSCKKEIDLYKPLAETMRSNWIKDTFNFDNYMIEITANAGSKNTGGKWTRPDLIAFGTKVYANLPGKDYEIITFEVKLGETFEIIGVYEALAHRRSAHRSFVMIYIANSAEIENIQEIQNDASKYGIGVITFSDPSDPSTWTILTDAERHNPDLQRLDEMIRQQFSEEMRSNFQKAVK